MAAKLPNSLRQPPTPEYTIGTMPVGSEYDFHWPVMRVDLGGSCYLNPAVKGDISGFVRVRRGEDGYHVTPLPGVRWTLEEIPESEKAGLIPVATVTECKRP